MAAIKAVAENADSRESFIDLMLTELDPNWKTVKDHVVTECEEGGEIDEDARVANIRSVAEYALAIEFANNLLELNSINPGEPMNGRLDDPVLSIPISRLEELPEDDPALRERVDVDFQKKYELNIYEFSAPLFREIDEDFGELFHNEYMKIMALGLLIENLIEGTEKGRMDIEDFADRCVIDIGGKNVLSIDGSQVAEEIARSLEKKGILKMKGNMIKWKA